MRRRKSGLVNVRAISGTHVIFLAFDMKESDAKGLMGFAIQRNDQTEDETVWLRGNKTFPSIRATSGFEDASSHEHPFQAFQWADYTVKPAHKYRYRVIPMYEKPGQLQAKSSTAVVIESEPLKGAKHEVHFNRSAIASQAFARRFLGQSLDEAGEAAYAWLGRDLVPALLDFIARAKDNTFSLHAALYEMHLPEQRPWPDVLAAFKAAKQAGADVNIIYHGLNDDTGKGNAQAIGNAQIGNFCFARTHAKLMHNKFIVLSKNGQPVSV